MDNENKIYEKISGAIKNKNHLNIQASVGSGKTHNSLRVIIEHCFDEFGEPNGNRCAFITSTIINCDEVVKKFKKIYFNIFKKDVNENIIYSLNSKNKNNIDFSKIKIVVSHHKYITRVNDLDLKYYEIVDNFLNTFTKNDVLIIDENDCYIDKLKINIPLSTRYISNKIYNNETQKIIQSKCQTTCQRKYLCDCCHKSDYVCVTKDGYDGLKYNKITKIEANKFNNFDSNWINIKQYIDINENNWKTIKEGKIDVFQLNIINQKSNNNIVDKKTFELTKDYVESNQKIIDYILENSYNIYCTRFMYEKEKLVLNDDSRNKYHDMLSQGVKTPYNCCNVETLSFYDMIFFKKMLNQTIVIMMSATYTTCQLDVIENYLGIQMCKIEYTKYTACDNLLIVGTDYNFYENENDNVNWNYFFEKEILEKNFIHTEIKSKSKEVTYRVGKKLVITSTKKECTDNYKLFNKSEESIIVDDGNDLSIDQHNTLVSYAGSAICRGVDIGQCDVAYIDCRIFKPTISYSPSINNDITFEKIVIEERRSLICQNVGRILRKFYADGQTTTSKNKVIVLLNCNRDDANFIKSSVESITYNCCFEYIKSIYGDANKSLIFGECCKKYFKHILFKTVDNFFEKSKVSCYPIYDINYITYDLFNLFKARFLSLSKTDESYFWKNLKKTFKDIYGSDDLSNLRDDVKKEIDNYFIDLNEQENKEIESKEKIKFNKILNKISLLTTKCSWSDFYLKSNLKRDFKNEKFELLKIKFEEQMNYLK